VIGHIAPVWLGFKGGKGVATALGVLTAISWPVGVLAALTWLGTAVLTRISSLSALIAIAAAPVYAWALADPQRAQLAAFIAVLVWLRHHENIRRLFKGQEPRIGGKKQSS
jgi:glycerol-3-phosphate acyltransferase PlsY